LPLWFLSAWLRVPAINPFLTSVEATAFACREIASGQTHFQADGEWLGRLPFRVTVVPNALRILLPGAPVRKQERLVTLKDAPGCRARPPA
jgi:hypothetical protein